MLALTSTPVAGELLAALSRRRRWQVTQVAKVGAAVSAMSQAERRQVRALVVETEPVGHDLIASLEELEVIVCPRSEPVNVDLKAADDFGVAVVHAPGRNAESVADFTLGLCLAALRSIAIAHNAIVAGTLTATQPTRHAHVAPRDVIWRPSTPGDPVPYHVYKGRELSSLIVGVVGYGAVGQAVARRFRGLARQVIVVDPAVSAESVSQAGLLPMSLDEMLPLADVVTLHARSDTVIIGRDQLAVMKQDSYLMNTARATVLDYDALTEAIDSGRLKGAALDVFPDEPLPHSSPLRAQAGLTLTPHLAGATEEVADRQYQIAARGLNGIYEPGGSWEHLPVRNYQVRDKWLRRRQVPQTPDQAGE